MVELHRKGCVHIFILWSTYTTDCYSTNAGENQRAQVKSADDRLTFS